MQERVVNKIYFTTICRGYMFHILKRRIFIVVAKMVFFLRETQHTEHILKRVQHSKLTKLDLS